MKERWHGNWVEVLVSLSIVCVRCRQVDSLSIVQANESLTPYMEDY
ncbi:hypothetical protein [Paenibacillus sp. 1781tsa1]|nr:hypothetical protein [Paenibacillus sp. 1781tsa1]MCP1187160.1 hypothetical protein [Paenibacillus sp. 1781tsa1]